MSARHAPPAFASRWLEEAAPRHLRDSVIGDLEEEWRARRSRGVLTADIWYCIHAAALALRLGWFDLTHKQKGRAGEHPRKGDGPMETLWNDARFGVRMLSRTPGFTFVAVLTLALGIGANTAIFSIVNALMIKPLPLPHSERLVSINGLDAKGQQQFLSFPDFEDLRKQQTTFEGLTAMVPQSVNLTGRSEPQRVRGGFVSDNFFGVVGVEPDMGRGFRSGDDALSAELVCVLQHETWQNVFGADPAILGKSIVLNNQPFTVVGVLPRGFRFPFDEVEVWMPYHTWPPFSSNNAYQSRTQGLVGPIGRLKPGISLDQGLGELKTIAARIATQFPEGGEGRSIQAQPLREVIVSNVRQMLYTLMGAVAFVLLIACSNVANLMLARAAARQREIATRAALGAGRGRLLKQMLTETALLWMAGGILGVGIGYFGLRALMASSPAQLPGGIVADLDWTVLLFALAICATTAMFFGALAAFRFSRPNLSGTLKDSGRAGESPRTARLGGALVVAQVALTLVMLVGSALLLRSFEQLTRVDVGFRHENLLTLEYRLPANKYPEGAQQWDVHQRIVKSVSAVPGVTSAAVVRAVPFGGNGSTATVEIPGAPPLPNGDPHRVLINFTDTNYFKTMGIPLLRGRFMTDQDGPTTPPIIVIGKRMAERYWPDQDPLGRSIVFPDPKNPITATIVGVVGDVKHFGLSERDRMQVYAFQAQQPNIFNSLVVRTTGDPMALSNAVRSAVWAVDPEQPMWKIYTMEFMINRSLGQPRFLMRLMTAYSALALLLAAVGLYGVMAYSVTQRATEIGVRMALGAQKNDVLSLILRRGARLTGLGLAIGIVASIGLGGSISSLLFGVRPTDPLSLIGAAAILTVVALVASYLPARRATQANPVTVLHRA